MGYNLLKKSKIVVGGIFYMPPLYGTTTPQIYKNF